MNLAAVAQRCATVAGGGQVEKAAAVDIAAVVQRRSTQGQRIVAAGCLDRATVAQCACAGKI